MYRRSFLKAMGITGLLSISNWKTLAKGPQPGDYIYKGVITKKQSKFAIAGVNIKAGMVVYWGEDNKVYPAKFDDPNYRHPNIAGFTIEDTPISEPVEVVTQGGMKFRKDKDIPIIPFKDVTPYKIRAGTARIDISNPIKNPPPKD